MRNDNIRKRLQVESTTERCRKAGLGWCGHVKRRDQDAVERKTLEMVPTGRRKRGRPKQRWMDCVYLDIRAIVTTNDEVHYGTGCPEENCVCRNDPQPKWERLEEEEAAQS